MYLTEVDTEVDGGASFFPEIDKNDWALLSSEAHPADDKNPHAYTFKVLERKA